MALWRPPLDRPGLPRADRDGDGLALAFGAAERTPWYRLPWAFARDGVRLGALHDLNAGASSWSNNAAAITSNRRLVTSSRCSTAIRGHATGATTACQPVPSLCTEHVFDFASVAAVGCTPRLPDCDAEGGAQVIKDKPSCKRVADDVETRGRGGCGGRSSWRCDFEDCDDGDGAAPIPARTSGGGRGGRGGGGGEGGGEGGGGGGEGEVGGGFGGGATGCVIGHMILVRLSTTDAGGAGIAWKVKQPHLLTLSSSASTPQLDCDASVSSKSNSSLDVPMTTALKTSLTRRLVPMKAVAAVFKDLPSPSSSPAGNTTRTGRPANQYLAGKSTRAVHPPPPPHVESMVKRKPGGHSSYIAGGGGGRAKQFLPW